MHAWHGTFGVLTVSPDDIRLWTGRRVFFGAGRGGEGKGRTPGNGWEERLMFGDTLIVERESVGGGNVMMRG